MNKDNRTNCDICGDVMEARESHNAEPLVKDGRCCSICNGDVIVDRLRRVLKSREDDKKEPKQ